MSNEQPTTADDCGHAAVSLRLEEALERIRAAVTPLRGRERCTLRAALGRVLAEAIHADANVPAHDNSAMDGYAVRSDDAGRDGLTCAGSAFAGHPYDGTLRPGECVRIMTGGVVPEGADAVVMQERVETDGDRVRVGQWPEPGNNIRRAGEDIARGERILAPGRRLTPADLGLLASLGVPEVGVYRRPRVAFFSTGDELRAVGEPLGAGEIHDSNRYTIAGMLARLDVDALDLGVVRDEPGALREALAAAAESSDVVITSGGVSVGAADYVTALLEEAGRVGFWRVAIKPGRPLAFGRLGSAHFFGLPGNPVSAMVTFYQLVAPALRRLAGEPETAPLRLRARTTGALRKRPGRQDFQRGCLGRGDDGELEVTGLGAQGSGILRSMSQADCFIVLPLESGDVAAGAWVEVEPFAGLI